MVGAVGSGAPCILSGWSEGTEVEFMIDTGCQVSILATSVFERMCASDPRLRSRLRLCGRRLISADSSPLMVQYDCGFPGLSCDMVLVVASIGSEGLLGSHAFLISSTFGQDSCGRMVSQHYSYISSDSLLGLPPKSPVPLFFLRIVKLWLQCRFVPRREYSREGALSLSRKSLLKRTKMFLWAVPWLMHHNWLTPALKWWESTGPSLCIWKTILHQYARVTGRTTAVHHNIDTQGARPVRCGPCRLTPVGLRTEQTCIREMLEGGHIASPVIVHGLLLWCQ